MNSKSHPTPHSEAISLQKRGGLKSQARRFTSGLEEPVGPTQGQVGLTSHRTLHVLSEAGSPGHFKKGSCSGSNLNSEEYSNQILRGQQQTGQ